MFKLIEGPEFLIKLLNISGMDDLFLNRMLFEWLRDRWNELAHVEIVSLKIFLNHANNH
jgi:hypothetical protein